MSFSQNTRLLILIFIALISLSAYGQPAGVVLVVTDDQGYGDINALFPSSLDTPNLDALHAESVRLTDFHVSPTCTPSRAALMTGRYNNAVGAWHTINGRSQLRRGEVTMGEVFKANGYKTGIFGKWHLGDNYPFQPRFRGFDVEHIHRGGGVSQMPDYWGNDYYSDVLFDGSPAVPDTYFKQGLPVVADEFVTDYWFTQAAQFITESKNAGEPFFCYLSTNAPHAPFNAPNGGKSGFDGLVENIDDNMARLETLLTNLGIKDDTLFIFMTDNGTAGNRLAGMRGTKGSRFDGGHRVPFFLRWKNGGFAGTAATAMDVPSLTAHIDVLPTLIELCGLTPVTAGLPMHGSSFVAALNGTPPTTDRVVITDSQRVESLAKWKDCSIMMDDFDESGQLLHKWRLTRANGGAAFQLHDILTDPNQNANLLNSFPSVASELEAAYELWWAEVTQGSDDYTYTVCGSDQEPRTILYSHDWHLGGSATAFNQSQIQNGANVNGVWAVEFEKAGRYRFELRRWPEETNATLGGQVAGTGATLPIASSEISAGGFFQSQAANPNEVASVHYLNLPAGKTTMQTWFRDSNGNQLAGAYYVYVELVDPNAFAFENLGATGTATQSTTFNNFNANLAKDSDTGTFSHTTSSDPAPWWEIDLGSEQAIRQVNIINRYSTANGGRLRDIRIELKAADGSSVFHSAVLNPGNSLGGGVDDFGNGPSVLTLDLPAPLPFAQKVRITREVLDPAEFPDVTNADHLSVLQMAEVSVTGLSEISNYGAYRYVTFTESEITTGLADANQDFDFDGISNLLEYTYFKNPKAVDELAPFRLSRSETTGTLLSYEQPKGMTDFSHVIESSENDLNSWTINPDYLELIDTTDLGDGEGKVYRLTPAALGKSKLFFRLRTNPENP
ncbi:sulfatase-like hydrolase/transferase [Oceaniferula spumae]